MISRALCVGRWCCCCDVYRQHIAYRHYVSTDAQERRQGGISRDPHVAQSSCCNVALHRQCGGCIGRGHVVQALVSYCVASIGPARTARAALLRCASLVRLRCGAGATHSRGQRSLHARGSGGWGALGGARLQACGRAIQSVPAGVADPERQPALATEHPELAADYMSPLDGDPPPPTGHLAPCPGHSWPTSRVGGTGKDSEVPREEGTVLVQRSTLRKSSAHATVARGSPPPITGQPGVTTAAATAAATALLAGARDGPMDMHGARTRPTVTVADGALVASAATKDTSQAEGRTKQGCAPVMPPVAQRTTRAPDGYSRPIGPDRAGLQAVPAPGGAVSDIPPLVRSSGPAAQHVTRHAQRTDPRDEMQTQALQQLLPLTLQAPPTQPQQPSPAVHPPDSALQQAERSRAAIAAVHAPQAPPPAAHVASQPQHTAAQHAPQHTGPQSATGSATQARRGRSPDRTQRPCAPSLPTRTASFALIASQSAYAFLQYIPCCGATAGRPAWGGNAAMQLRGPCPRSTWSMNGHVCRAIDRHAFLLACGWHLVRSGLSQGGEQSPPPPG